MSRTNFAGRLLQLGCVMSGMAVMNHPVVADDESGLSPRLSEVPFCYISGGTRSWPLREAPLADNEKLRLVARQKKKTLGEGGSLKFDGLQISTTRKGWLKIVAAPDSKTSFQLELILDREGESLRRVVSVRPAPPDRPISYVSDLVDDLIHNFWNSSKREFRPFTKPAFDQYFRRLQAHGVNRLSGRARSR